MNFDTTVDDLANRYALALAACVLREEGYSLRQIGWALGRSHTWVRQATAGGNVVFPPSPGVQFE